MIASSPVSGSGRKLRPNRAAVGVMHVILSFGLDMSDINQNSVNFSSGIPQHEFSAIGLRAGVVENLYGVAAFQYQPPAGRCYSYRPYTPTAKKTENLDRKSDVKPPKTLFFSAAARHFNNSYV